MIEVQSSQKNSEKNKKKKARATQGVYEIAKAQG